MKKLIITTGLLLSLATSVLAVPITLMETTIGQVLVDSNGMTLYTTKGDQEGVSNCYDDCAANWPPYLAADGEEVSGDFTIITRTDETKQWAYKGAPLYTWTGDKDSGDTTGEAVNDVWYAAKQ
ncbi:MAG: hypothetical protein COB13_005770 [OCS116 cluster bacterium]|uniref:Lipoprotein with Yx(FWY)xxD motif n=1 Tax=OCS116 cluster bacterium TaxID=2030921 RepID=A0A2A4YRG2_9PROT|nr:hypothetical protein [OCS116 cluster bacterium]